MGQIIAEKINKSFSFYVHSGVLKRERKKIDAVKDISFAVRPGEIMGLVGANGAGKTTIVKIAAGVLKPDSGTVLVRGEDPFRRSAAYRNSVAMVLGQKGKLHADMSVLESAAVYGAMYRLSAAETQRRILQFAALLKLTQDDLSKQSRALSLGQRMKGELCLSFINEPTVIFLDEPTLGLDLPSTRAIRRFLKQYCVEHNAAIILTSHDLGDIAQTSTDLLIINAGEQVFYGGINELPNHFEKRTRIRYEVTAPDAAEKICEKIPNTTFIGLEATTLCQTAQVNDTLNALYQLSAILNLRMEETPFEDMIEDILHEG